MTKLGVVKNVIRLEKREIVAVEVTAAARHLPLKIGSTVRVHGSDFNVTGMKYWPDRNLMDLLLDRPVEKPFEGAEIHLNDYGADRDRRN